MSERIRNPEQILQALEREGQGRGRLRVFLGMCPGVGKTYSMLKAAKEQMARGREVVVGVVETHRRKETEELLSGLTILPKKSVLYRETTLLEMDLDRLMSSPGVLVLVDELAHTNAPGSRHSKRYQDVEELLAAGVDVYTTVNIQHIESRNDQVRQITGVSVRETVPDAFLERATQLELVDLSPDELLQRLRDGKVYLGEAATAAENNFFKEEQLLALRELALRFTAEKVDQDLSDQMAIKGIAGPWNTQERLLVAISQSPHSARLIRATRRMAYSLEAPWLAVYVDLGKGLERDDEVELQKNMMLARNLGAEVLSVVDVDVAVALQRVCEERNVTQIVMGRPDRRFIRDWLSRGSLLDQLVRATSRIDVHVIRAQRRPRYKGFHLDLPKLTTGLNPYLQTGAFLAVVTLLSAFLYPHVGYKALGSIFLLAILVVSSVASRGPIFFAALASSVIWDFFFIPPRFTFAINNWDDAMMVLSFGLTALVGGLLTSRIRRQEFILQSREERTRTLYEFVQRLADARALTDISVVVKSVMARLFVGRSALFLVGSEGKMDWTAADTLQLNESELAVVRWSFENDKSAGWSTATLSAARIWCLPLRGKSGVVGILAFQPANAKGQKARVFSIDQEAFLQSILAQAAIAIERFLFSEAVQRAKIYEASEELHQTLLNSVSHELRTPITALIGSASALKDSVTFADPQARAGLTDELIRSAQRLNHVVENLLDLSRLQKSGLSLKREWFDLTDLVEAARTHLQEDLRGHRLVISKDESVLVEGDFQLLCHALNQLILNAAKYSPTGTIIEVQLLKSDKRAVISVRDEGVGLPADQTERVFEKFFRIAGTPTGGLGLGLTIVKSIVELHGGTVGVQNRADRSGANFVIQLPLVEAPSELTEALK